MLVIKRLNTSSSQRQILQQIGDFVVVLAGPDGKMEAPELPPDLHKISLDDSLADYFW